MRFNKKNHFQTCLIFNVFLHYWQKNKKECGFSINRRRIANRNLWPVSIDRRECVIRGYISLVQENEGSWPLSLWTFYPQRRRLELLHGYVTGLKCTPPSRPSHRLGYDMHTSLLIVYLFPTSLFHFHRKTTWHCLNTGPI